MAVDDVRLRLSALMAHFNNSIAASTTSAPAAPTMALAAVPAGQIWKSYYRAGSQLIAMRVDGDPNPANNGLFYLHSDHLGSASLTTDSSGNVVSRQLYDAWGNVRASASTGQMPTDIGYTGQRFDTYIKLVQMGARWYDPDLGRWLSPDTIVPDPGNPQSLNRYTYVNNNPMKHIDPTGHRMDSGCQTEGSGGSQSILQVVRIIKDVIDPGLQLWNKEHPGDLVTG